MMKHTNHINVLVIPNGNLEKKTAYIQVYSSSMFCWLCWVEFTVMGDRNWGGGGGEGVEGAGQLACQLING